MDTSAITDDFMNQMLAASKEYTIVLLKAGPVQDRNDLRQIVWEHGRRNFALRNAGLVSIVCPITDGGPLKGIAIFNTGVQETKQIMEDDPGVKEGIFVYEVHTGRSFPGDHL